MQMSIERFREVHKIMWNEVIAHAEEIKTDRVTVHFLKQAGIDKAYRKGLLDLDEVIVIENNCNCLLCAACTSCMDCILENCWTSNSLFHKVLDGNVSAMKEIRDIVDKWPFTEFSIVTLYDV